MTRIRHDLFNARKGLDRGRPRLVEAIWYLLKWALFLTPLPFPSAMKRGILRCFGARVGVGVIIKPRVNIHFPWKLILGDHAWLGEEVFILNFEPVAIGAHCCVSQRAFLCTGNHDYAQPDMPYRNAPITVEAGAWVGAQVFISPGVTIGTEAVIVAGSVVMKNQPARMICSGNPCLAMKSRWPKTDSMGLRAFMSNTPHKRSDNSHYRNILGVRFFVGDAPEAVENEARGAVSWSLTAAPALVEMEWDGHYREALAAADLVITDSGLLVMAWNTLKWDRIHRVSGLEYLQLLLRRPEFQQRGWPRVSGAGDAIARINGPQSFLAEIAQGYVVTEDDCLACAH